MLSLTFRSANKRWATHRSSHIRTTCSSTQ